MNFQCLATWVKVTALENYNTVMLDFVAYFFVDFIRTFWFNF